MKVRPITDDGREWHMYGIEYDTPDGTFSFYIRAISREHAAAMLEDIKTSARVIGNIVHIIPASGV